MEGKKETRCFVGIEIPDEMKKKLIEIRKELEIDGVHPVEDTKLHITLKFFGAVPEEKIETIQKALAQIKRQPFMVQLYGTGVFPDENYTTTLWVGTKSIMLEMLADEIQGRLATDFKKESITPHLTIARIKKKVDLHAFLEKHKHDDFGSFKADTFKLIKSELKQEGAVYTEIASFTL